MPFTKTYAQRVGHFDMADITWNSGTTAAEIAGTDINWFGSILNEGFVLDGYDPNQMDFVQGKYQGKLMRNITFKHDGTETAPEASLTANRNMGLAIQLDASTYQVIAGPSGGTYNSWGLTRGPHGATVSHVHTEFYCSCSPVGNVLQKDLTVS